MSKTLSAFQTELPLKSVPTRYGWFGFAALPWVVFILALALNLATVWRRGFDGLYGQDAYSYFAHAGELRYNLSVFHHWQWEAGPRLLYWPVGYPALVAVLFLLTGATAGAAQLVSLLTWAGTAGLLVSVGQKLSGRWLVGLVAGGGLALSPLGRQVAISVMADAPTLFWTVLAAWLVLKTRESGQGWYLVGAGFAPGLAGITRYAALPALSLLAIGALWPAAGRVRIANKWLVFSIIAAGLVYAVQFTINQVYPASFWTNSWLAESSPVNLVKTEFTTRDGFAAYPTSPLVFYLGFSLLNLRFLTALALPLVGLGLFWLWRKRDGFGAIWLLGWWWLSVLMLSLIPYENERYSLTFLPPLALLVGLGVGQVEQFLKGRWWQIGLTIALVVSAVGLGVISQRHVEGFINVKEDDLAITRQIEARLPAQATLITFGLSLTFDHYTTYKVRDLWFLDPDSVASLAQGPETYLLADPENMARQWAGQHVGVAFEAARSRTNGEPLAKFGKYYLWRLR